VLALSLIFMASLAWGVARVARTGPDDGAPGAPDSKAARTADERPARFRTGSTVASAPGA
jgi:hypothetical protein